MVNLRDCAALPSLINTVPKDYYYNNNSEDVI